MGGDISEHIPVVIHYTLILVSKGSPLVLPKEYDWECPSEWNCANQTVGLVNLPEACRTDDGNLSVLVPYGTSSGVDVFGIDGRHVGTLTSSLPGANAISDMGPGLYHVRQRGRDAATATWAVVR